VRLLTEDRTTVEPQNTLQIPMIRIDSYWLRLIHGCADPVTIDDLSLK
jgi:hypothetical protein